jgi:hypothetical protein
VVGIRTLEDKIDRELAGRALADRTCWEALIDRAIGGDEVALATVSSMCGRLIFTLHRGRHRWVDDHDADVMEALWTAIVDRPASPDELVKVARRVMGRAARHSQRAMRDVLAGSDAPIVGRTATRFEDDLVATLDARRRLSSVLPMLNARELRTFGARAGLTGGDAETASPTARSAVRNARRRLSLANPAP